ncbi:Threonine/homoserine/homoserine lactone efflux protein [Dehalogenimonas formicexedens]|uniref:Threonine/homoserine/homoserine lactone efflux protein n=1 Tax=Dehalogenimonas formicexedens TaxID=1839801 RepID=A0A1P8FAF7_9CHLR|nr:LysE family transporter [Dehalogenimonas formicexedens]APV45447.1 Threonine/homoserine/homoserine lactone efflux protein [Dehalogenimonas formicexedens]
MLALLASVFVISLSGALMPGPVFATVLVKSCKSQWAGVQASLGHAVIEVPLIILIYFGAAAFFAHTAVQFVLGVAGGAMVVWMGVGMFRARKAIATSQKDTAYSAFTAGIILSVGNPFFLLWWATVGALLVSKASEFGAGGLWGLILTHWLTDLIWMSFVSAVVFRTHRLWAPALQESVFILCSLLLVGFGGWFMVSGIQAVI